MCCIIAVYGALFSTHIHPCMATTKLTYLHVHILATDIIISRRFRRADEILQRERERERGSTTKLLHFLALLGTTN